MDNFFNETNIIDEMNEEERGRWSIDNDATADWALQKVAAEEADYARLEEIAKAQKAAIDAKLAEAKKRMENNTSFLRGCLLQYFETVPHTQNKSKTSESYKLLSGSLVWKYDGKKPEHNDAELLKWLEENGMNEYIKKEVKWGDFKKLLDLSTQTVATVKETGQVVDGVKFVTDEGSFDIKVNKPKS